MWEPEESSTSRERHLIGASSIANEIWERMKAWVALRSEHQTQYPSEEECIVQLEAIAREVTGRHDHGVPRGVIEFYASEAWKMFRGK
jgi:hypothetical protein